MASYRHLARVVVMQTLYAYEFRQGVDPAQMLKYASAEYVDKLKDVSFAEKLLNGVLMNRNELLKIIAREAPEWPVERIAPVDRAILEIGIYEVVFCQDIPAPVAINEAVEIAKEFGDLNSGRFINGVLSTVMNKYKKEHGDK